MPSAVALIPARAGSQRVPGKNIRLLAGHPLIAYAIAAARESDVFEAIVVSTDSGEIAWTRVVTELGDIAGRRIAPFLTEGAEGFSVDYPEDLERAERLLAAGAA